MGPSSNYATTQIKRLFKRGAVKNIGKGEFFKEINVAHLAGISAGLYEIIEKYREFPVKDAELIMGDIIEFFVLNSNEICDILQTPNHNRVRVEDVLIHAGVIKHDASDV